MIKLNNKLMEISNARFVPTYFIAYYYDNDVNSMLHKGIKKIFIRNLYL